MFGIDGESNNPVITVTWEYKNVLKEFLRYLTNSSNYLLFIVLNKNNIIISILPSPSKMFSTKWEVTLPFPFPSPLTSKQNLHVWLYIQLSDLRLKIDQLRKNDEKDEKG